MKTLPLVLIFALNACHSTPPETHCALNEQQPDSWATCIGKNVKLHGTLATPVEIQQHPLLTMTGEQAYLNVGQTQIILTSAQRLDCPAALWVEGSLESIDLGGAPATKLSYRGWALAVKNYGCQ